MLPMRFVVDMVGVGEVILFEFGVLWSSVCYVYGCGHDICR